MEIRSSEFLTADSCSWPATAYAARERRKG